MARAAAPHLGLLAAVLATLAQLSLVQSCVPLTRVFDNNKFTTRGPSETPTAAAQVQTSTPAPSSPPARMDVLGLVARSIFGVPAANSITPGPSTFSTAALRLGLLPRLAALEPAASVPGAPSQAANAVQPENGIKYTDRYDFVSIDHVLRSPRLMHNFHQCLMGRGPCTSEAAELRRIIPEAVRSDCSRCTERQRQQAGRVLVYILQHRPDWWQDLIQRFDTDGSIRRRYEFEIDEPAATSVPDTSSTQA